LRQKFEELARFDRKVQLVELESLRKIYAHTVFPLTDGKVDLQFNCVMYAMDLHKNSGYINFYFIFHTVLKKSWVFLLIRIF